MKISVIGGDLRLVKLAISLAEDKNEVYTFGMENSNEIENNKEIVKCRRLEETIEHSKIIICSIPFSNDTGELYTAYREKNITIDDLIRNKHKDKILIAGNIEEKFKKILDDNYEKVIDIMKMEELVILNTIATAEGAIDVAIKNTDTILHGSNVLILGFGRVGKIVATKFNQLAAKVTCAARKNTDLAWIEAMGFTPKNLYDLKENLKDFDIIINTIPQMIIDKEEMQYMKENVLLIDLASSPGGINTDDAKEMNLKFVWALALPGKVAPVTSAEFIKKTIYDLIDDL